MKTACLIAGCLAFVAIAGCEQDRFELGKDATGNTVRLNKRTGEIAVIKGENVYALKDAAQAQAERKAALADLEKLKSWPHTDTSQLDARFTLSTAWRGEAMYYQFDVYWLKAAKAFDRWIDQPKEKNAPIPEIDPKQRGDALQKAVGHRPFTIELNDKNGFRLAQVNVAQLTRVVADDGTAMSYQSKGATSISEDNYSRIANWELGWRR